MDTIENVNHAISIVRYCIFESNYQKALFLTKESLDLICSLFFDEEKVENFETVF